MPLGTAISDFQCRLQGELFPALAAAVGPLSGKAQLLVSVIEMAPFETVLAHWRGVRGRPPSERRALAHGFVAKAVYGIAHTSTLIERLRSDATLRLLCGWSRPGAVPSEATFSRAFAEFAAADLPTRVHEALIKATHKDRLVGHVSRDATAIEAREAPVKVDPPPRCRKKVKPERGEPGWETLNRLDRQRVMTVSEMLADLPKTCAVGIKPCSKGRKTAWIGYKLHLDVADGDIPLTGLLTSASLHDSQAAIPLMRITAGRCTSCYDVMDSGYDMPQLHQEARDLGHVPIIKEQPRRGQKSAFDAEARARRHANFQPAELVRYRERTSAERVNARLKEEFGGRHVHVVGHAKVMCHLMFGLLALSVDQLLRLTI